MSEETVESSAIRCSQNKGLSLTFVVSWRACDIHRSFHSTKTYWKSFRFKCYFWKIKNTFNNSSLKDPLWNQKWWFFTLKNEGSSRIADVFSQVGHSCPSIMIICVHPQTWGVSAEHLATWTWCIILLEVAINCSHKVMDMVSNNTQVGCGV